MLCHHSCDKSTEANVPPSFVVSFTLPYLLDPPYAALESKVGFIYGSMSFLSLVFGYFFLPEVKGHSLEEIEDMFAARLPLRKFGQYESSSTGMGAAITRLEQGDEPDPALTKIPQAQEEQVK